MEKEKESVSVSSQFELRTYTGTKTVKAAPMSANCAKHYGAQITEETINENISNDGYLVEYPDGYRSWSPKAAFDAAYKVSETHVDRMKIELEELNERICKAERALNTYGAIPEDDRLFLKRQLEAMRGYADILYDRIRWTVEPATIDCGGCGITKEGGK